MRERERDGKRFCTILNTLISKLFSKDVQRSRKKVAAIVGREKLFPLTLLTTNSAFYFSPSCAFNSMTFNFKTLEINLIFLFPSFSQSSLSICLEYSNWNCKAKNASVTTNNVLTQSQSVKRTEESICWRRKMSYEIMFRLFAIPKLKTLLRK